MLDYQRANDTHHNLFLLLQKLVVPSTGYQAGQTFGFGFDYGANEEWVAEEGVFNIGTAGDSIFLYCYGLNGTINPLVGFSNDDAWAEAGLDPEEYGSQQSALPVQLEEVGAVVLPHFDNYVYKGSMRAMKADLQQNMTDPENWEGADDGLGDVNSGGGSSRRHNAFWYEISFLLLSGLYAFL